MVSILEEFNRFGLVSNFKINMTKSMLLNVTVPATGTSGVTDRLPISMGTGLHKLPENQYSRGSFKAVLSQLSVSVAHDAGCPVVWALRQTLLVGTGDTGEDGQVALVSLPH